jgi:Cytochrome c554 and c-prime
MRSFQTTSVQEVFSPTFRNIGVEYKPYQVPNYFRRGKGVVVWKGGTTMYFKHVMRISWAVFAAAAFLTIPGDVNSAAQQTVADPTSGVGKYNGPGGCAASSCHGSVKPKNVTKIWQNEFSIWAAQDKHARAYSVLSNPVSQRIGKILKLEQPPNKSEKCLVCHALYVPSDLRATTFQPDDGVSCENCHGPAVGWLGPHTTEGWQHYSAAEKAKYGMYDTRDLTRRSEKCATCHVGTADKQVDHEMIAAGHPDLTFELDSFSAAMPKHWKTDRPDDDTRLGVQTWAIGEAVQLRESLNRLSRRASGPNWPDYAELDCFACHHSLTLPGDSWRLTTTDYYQARRPGVPAWNASHYLVFRNFAAIVDPPDAQRMDNSLNHLSALMGKWANPQEISSAALDSAGSVQQILQKIVAQRYDPNLTARIMQAIAGNAETISDGGERTAEQATMALDSLFIAYSANTKVANESEVRAAINKLFQQLQNPSAYNAPQFKQQLQHVQALLPHASSTQSGG